MSTNAYRQQISNPEQFCGPVASGKNTSTKKLMSSLNIKIVSVIALWCLAKPSQPNYFLFNRYFPATTSSSSPATFSPKNSCNSSALQGNPSGTSIFIIMAT